MNENYPLASAPGGASLFAAWSRVPPPSEGWADGIETGTVDHVNFLWTPGRNADGLVTAASVALLPLNTWYKVAGTQLTQLNTLLSAQGWTHAAQNRSNGKSINATFTPWVGCAFDGSMKIYYPRGGGHGDSSVNGTWELDFARMRWGIIDMPSRQDVPGQEWPPQYYSATQNPLGNITSFTNYAAGNYQDSYDTWLEAGDNLYADMLPDGKPTSCHTYNGLWYDSNRHEVGTSRISKWTLDLSSRIWTRKRWSWSNTTPTAFDIRGQYFFHKAKDCLYGFPGRSVGDYTSFGKCPLPGSRWYSIDPKPPTFNYAGIAGIRLSEDEILFFWTTGTNSERWGIFNMVSETWASGSGVAGITNGRPVEYADAEMMPCVIVPSWGSEGQVIRRGTKGKTNGAWWVFDLATKTNLNYVRAAEVGDVQRLGVGFSSYYTGQPGNKWLNIPKAGMCMMLDDGLGHTGNAVMVMRY